ncbi:hypothetical protein SNE25_13705 [Mucilaginibacter sabulilitoris]|uniref:Uncharacterized protein n=1 Tax=Mucilaginibacter sabulilitoris TaxID=1173583 RepID=A0ABZ0TXN0_9SPHI|nr:hypothetical protein [Mucilaginibacter sabulilitoris]WPU96574.1 hypothetical protein SNE25_13705 [Mucilaginibacter sabulilitoris]
MKPKLLYSLFFIILLGCWTSTECFAIGTDTVKAHKPKRVVKHISPHVSYLRESIKGYKPWFDNCTFTNQYTVAQRLKKYPFSKAVKILAVSFNGGAPPNPEIIIDRPKPQDTMSYREQQLYKGFTIINDSLDYSTLYEVKTLNQDQIIRLTNIMYNAVYKKILANTADPGSSCYNPRNAFVFLNKKGRVIDYLEICFECEEYRSKYGRLTIGDNCTQKFGMIKKCFIDAGIKHGTIDLSWK